MKKLIIFICVFTFTLFGQSKNADAIIKDLKDAFGKINDYTVNVIIKTDISFIKVPPMNAKIYFKKPDKIHFESKGFALLPRNGMYTSPMSFLNGDYTAIYVKDDEINGYRTAVIKVIPLNDKGDLILTTLWIDRQNNVIRKVESSTKTNGTFSLILNYDTDLKYHLPSSMVFSFNMPKLERRRGIPVNPNEKPENNGSDMMSGKIFVTYSDYVVNKGISDSLFVNKNNNFN